MSDEVTTEVPAIDVTTMVDDQGNFTDDFRSSIPEILGEGFEEFKGLDKYNNLPELLKGTAHLSKKVGEKVEGMVKIPGENATEEEIEAYRQAIGVPESVEGYEFTRRQLAEGQKFDKEGEAAFKAFALEKGWTPKTAQEAIEFFDKYEEQIVTRMAEEQVKSDKEANEAFDKKHGENAEKVRRQASEAMAKTGFTDNVLNHLESRYKGIENDPVIIDWFNEHIVPKILPGKLHDGQPGGDSPKTEGLKGIYNHKTSKEQLHKQ